MIDIRKLKELIKLMVENDLTEINLQDQQETVAVKRGGLPGAGGGGAVGQPVVYQAPVAAPSAVTSAAPAPAAKAEAAAAASGAAKDADAGLVAINSPMVGTFYASANPESPAFVKVGQAVGADTTVCLVEAMKVFNEIKAETSGTIERVLVQSGQAVEYGQKMFLVRPS